MTMPYLLPKSHNRVENIKKKFENCHFDEREGNNLCKNYKPFTSPSKTKALQVLKCDLENDSDSSIKYQFQKEKYSDKSEVNKADGKAVVRRSPAFRRVKLSNGKVTNLYNVKDNPVNQRKKFFTAKPESRHNNITEPLNSVKLEHDNSREQIRENNSMSNAVQFFPTNKSTSFVNLGTNLRTESTDITTQDQKKNSKNVINDKILGQCSGVNAKQSEKVNCESRNCDLKLTDSIRIALKSPLPKGPPPKKPPRTFLHTAKDVQTEINHQESSAKLVTKKDPSLQLKLEKIEKVIKNLDVRNHINMPWEGNKPELAKIVPAEPDVISNSSHGSSGKPLDHFCLRSLNCAAVEKCNKSVTQEYEFERQSSFYVECSKPAIHSNKTDVKNSVSLGNTLSYDLAARKCEGEPIYDLPCVAKKSNFESFGKVAKENKSTMNKQQQLHYMVTDVVSSLKVELISSKISPFIESDPVINNCKTEKSSGTKIDPFHNAHATVKNFNESATLNNCPFEGKTRETITDSKNLMMNEKMKKILNDFFNSDNSKRSYKSLKSAGAETDTDSGSESPNLDDSVCNSESTRLYDIVTNGRNCDGVCPASSKNEKRNVPQEPALRKSESRIPPRQKNQPYLTKSISKQSYTHLFESCILVGLALNESKNTIPHIISIFPANVKPPPLIESLCFPDACTWSDGSNNHQQGEQYYSLVITNENGERKFGYCRRVLPEGGTFCLPLVYCIISPHRANGFYYKVLQELESRHGSSAIQDFIRQLYECNFPGPGQSLKFKMILEKVTNVPLANSEEYLCSTVVRRPCDIRQEERDLSQLLQHLKVSVLLKVFSSLLLERKVLLLSESLKNLSCCVEALQSLLVPFSWQHTFIPVLPNHLNEICDAPTPFIIGLQKSTKMTERLTSLNFEEGIIVELEESVIIRSCGDEGSILPQRLTKELKMALNLAINASTESDNDRNVHISEAFIRFFVEICGNYEFFVEKQSDGNKIFQKENFVHSASPSIHSFLERFVETAMFSSFIQERLRNDIDDVFRRRILEHRDEMEKHWKNKKMKSLGNRIKDLTLFTK